MRSDMSEVLTECSRTRKRVRFRGVRRLKASRLYGVATDDDAANSEPIRRRYQLDCADDESSIRSRPLVRFLRSRLGRPWADVLSEICRGVDRRSAARDYIRNHLEWLVEQNAVFTGGVACYPDSRSPIWGRDQFYVDSRDGTLREAPSQLPAATDHAPVRKELSPRLQLHRRDGVWYEVHLKDIDVDERTARELAYVHRYRLTGPPTVAFLPRDALLGTYALPPARAAVLYGGCYYAHSARRLSSIEVKNYGLK